LLRDGFALTVSGVAEPFARSAQVARPFLELARAVT